MANIRGDGTERPRVLVVEDEQPAIRLFEEAFGELDGEVAVTVATDGEQALDLLFDRQASSDVPLPDVIVLDLDLPTVGGKEVLRAIRDDDQFGVIPVVIYSQNDDQATIDECYRLGASAYFVKPQDYEGLLEVTERILSFWGADAVQFPSMDDDE